jgi:hypothetical protein
MVTKEHIEVVREKGSENFRNFIDVEIEILLRLLRG